MDGRPTWTDCDEAGDYVVPNVLSPRDLVFRPDNMDETVPLSLSSLEKSKYRICGKDISQWSLFEALSFTSTLYVFIS